MTVTMGHQSDSVFTEPDSARLSVQSALPKHAALIQNPVLPGFHPDPSLLRIGADYYLATSTCEWAPAVTVHHSRDLVNWRSLGGVLDRPGMVDLAGAPDSGGVWAPHLSHADGVFRLVFSAVRNYQGAFRDVQTYAATATMPEGPWSDPRLLPVKGFDASLFRDDDGRDWLLSASWDHRPGREPFGGIVIREFDVAAGQLVGSQTNIFAGTELGVVEGPRLYRRQGWYYLVTAEGGTSYEHAVTVARSRELLGPYEVHPTNPLVSSFDRLDLPLQKVGHASLVEAADGTWWMAALCARPLTPLGRCVLGRETAIMPVSWDAQGWPHVVGGVALQQVPGPQLRPHPWPKSAAGADFGADRLGPEWLGLRRLPTDEWADLVARPGYLRLRGGESLGSTFRPALVARRQQHHSCVAQTVLSFEPESFEHMAGLVHYYQSGLWHYLRVTDDEALGRCLGVLSCDHGRLEQRGTDVSLAGLTEIHLRAEIRGDVLQFSYGVDGGQWTPVGPCLDASRMSDEYATVWRGLDAVSQGFTGAFLGMAAQDLTGAGHPADFGSFTYRPLTSPPTP